MKAAEVRLFMAIAAQYGITVSKSKPGDVTSAWAALYVTLIRI
jgi:hypothetical protein